MKRDMELVRQILLRLSDHPHGHAPRDLQLDGYASETVGYHCLIMKEAGLIEAVEMTASSDPSPSALPLRLTWAGHDFVESAQNDKVWAQTREVMQKVGDASFSVWTSVLTQTVMRNLGL